MAAHCFWHGVVSRQDSIARKQVMVQCRLIYFEEYLGVRDGLPLGALTGLYIESIVVTLDDTDTDIVDDGCLLPALSGDGTRP